MSDEALIKIKVKFKDEDVALTADGQEGMPLQGGDIVEVRKSRYATLLRNRNLRSPSTLQSAIGVHHPTIRQLAQGAMGGSFNTRAFMHDYGASVLRLVRRGFILTAFVIPLLLLSLGDETSLLIYVLAFVLQYLGLLAERWYFFIEAEHPQNIYYQMIS